MRLECYGFGRSGLYYRHATRRIFRLVEFRFVYHACPCRCLNREQAELVNFNGGRVQPQSLEPKHALTFRVEIGGHMVCNQTLYSSTVHASDERYAQHCMYVSCTTCVRSAYLAVWSVPVIVNSEEKMSALLPRLLYLPSGVPIINTLFFLSACNKLTNRIQLRSLPFLPHASCVEENLA